MERRCRSFLLAATRSFSLPGTENIFGLICLTSRGFSPVRVLVCLSEYSKNSSPFVVWRSCTSPQHIFRCSLHPRRPKWIVLLNQIVFSRASGVDVPKDRFTRYDFAAYDKLTTRLRHELLRVNQIYNSLNGPKSCRRPVVSLSYATKSYRVNRP